MPVPDARPSVGDLVLSVSGQLMHCQRRANHQDLATTCHRMGGDPEANRTVKEDDMALGCEPMTST